MVYVENVGDVSIEGGRVQWIIDYTKLKTRIFVPEPLLLPGDFDVELIARNFNVAGVKWELRLFPNGHSYDEIKGWIGVVLLNETLIESHSTTGRRYNVVMSVVGGHGEEIMKFVPEVDAENTWYTRRQLIYRKDFDNDYKKFSLNNALVIFCDIKCDEETQTETEAYVDRHLQDYKTLLFSRLESDLTVKAQDKEYRVSRDILGSRSPVLSSLLKLDKAEKGPEILELEGIEPDVIPDFLHYLYIRVIGKETLEKVIALYTVAEKYEIKELNLECLEYLKTNISVKNFCDIMSLSLKRDNKELIEIATQFFLKNAKAIVATEKWKKFLKENPDAANELIQKLLEAESKQNLEKSLIL